MIRACRTYQDVAKELSEGIASGTVTLGEDDQRNALGMLAAFLIRSLSSTRLEYLARGLFRMTVEVTEDEFFCLPDHVKLELKERLKELEERGVEVEIKDVGGRTILFARPHPVETTIPSERSVSSSQG